MNANIRLTTLLAGAVLGGLLSVETAEAAGSYKLVPSPAWNGISVGSAVATNDGASSLRAISLSGGVLGAIKSGEGWAVEAPEYGNRNYGVMQPAAYVPPSELYDLLFGSWFETQSGNGCAIVATHAVWSDSHDTTPEGTIRSSSRHYEPGGVTAPATTESGAIDFGRDAPTYPSTVPHIFSGSACGPRFAGHHSSSSDRRYGAAHGSISTSDIYSDMVIYQKDPTTGKSRVYPNGIYRPYLPEPADGGGGTLREQRSLKEAYDGAALSIRDFVVPARHASDLIVWANPEGDSVYIYREVNGAWREEQKLTNPDGETALFGARVIADGDLMIVGAPLANANGTHSGAVYIYQNIGNVYQYVGKLVSDYFGDHDYFGYALDLAGDTAVVGAPGDSEVTTSDGQPSGAVFVFENIRDNCYID